MSAETYKALVQQAFEAWNASGEAFDTWARQAISPSIAVEVPVLTMTGVDAFLAYFATVRAAFPDAHVEISDVVADRDTLIVRYTFSGTNTGTLLSRPIVTNKRASFSVVDVYHFADGKVVHFWQTYDRLAMLEQLDALEAAASVP